MATNPHLAILNSRFIFFSGCEYNDISLYDMMYDMRRMIYLLHKHDIISVLLYAKGIYHPAKADIIPAGYITRSEGNGYH